MGNVSDTHERYLGRYFEQADCYVSRSGSSGSGHRTDVYEYPGPTDDRCQPDVLVAQNGAIYLFELKTGEPPFYVDSDEVVKLQWAADQLNARALLAARFNGDQRYHIFEPSAVRRTDGDTYRLDADQDPLAALRDPRQDVQDPYGVPAADVAMDGIWKVLWEGDG